MSNTTNHQSTSELSWLFGKQKLSYARDRDRDYLRTRILKTERELLGEDVSYKRYYIDPERKYRGERIARIIDDAIDDYLLWNIFPQISCTDQGWNKQVFAKNEGQQWLYWKLWHAASNVAREIVEEDKHIGYYPAIKKTIKTIYIGHMENARKYGATPTEVEKQFRQLFKADLKNIRKLIPSISIELKDNGRDMTNSRRMKLEDYVIWAGCAYLLIIQEKKKKNYVFHEGDTVYIEGRKRRK